MSNQAMWMLAPTWGATWMRYTDSAFSGQSSRAWACSPLASTADARRHVPARMMPTHIRRHNERNIHDMHLPTSPTTSAHSHGLCSSRSHRSCATVDSPVVNEDGGQQGEQHEAVLLPAHTQQPCVTAAA